MLIPQTPLSSLSSSERDQLRQYLRQSPFVLEDASSYVAFNGKLIPKQQVREWMNSNMNQPLFG